jgi:LmbE family N-acetylglucosaminyl deacetylase
VDFLEQLKSGQRIDRPVVLVLAHPDDETASAGGLLQRLERVRLIYLTDGAPRDLIDAKRVGCDSASDYAILRKRELHAALRQLGFGVEPIFYDCPDKEALEHLSKVVERLAVGLGGAKAVVTHSFEHGHPDHDTAAVAVALASSRLGSSAPERFEFAGYHLTDDGPVFGAFWPGGEEVALQLSQEELERKRRAISAFESQRQTLAQFPLAPERFRRAPEYDVATAAPPGQALYDLYGWEITSQLWRSRLREILR